jgi:hypothetical protein
VGSKWEAQAWVINCVLDIKQLYIYTNYRTYVHFLSNIQERKVQKKTKTHIPDAFSQVAPCPQAYWIA